MSNKGFKMPGLFTVLAGTLLVIYILEGIGVKEKSVTEETIVNSSDKWSSLEAQCSLKAKQSAKYGWDYIDPYLVSNTMDRSTGLITINIQYEKKNRDYAPYKFFCRVKGKVIVELITKEQ